MYPSLSKFSLTSRVTEKVSSSKVKLAIFSPLASARDRKLATPINRRGSFIPLPLSVEDSCLLTSELEQYERSKTLSHSAVGTKKTFHSTSSPNQSIRRKYTYRLPTLTC